MITDNLWLVLSTALVNGINPKTREALNVIQPEMIEDAFSLKVFESIKALDNFGSAVSIESVSKLNEGKIDFYDITQAVRNSGTTTDPMYKAMQVSSLHNDKKAAKELRDILEKLETRKPFDRNDMYYNISKINDLIAPVSNSEPVSYADYADRYVNVLEERQANPSGSFLDVGVGVQIDKTALVVIGGQPGMGKTALALFCNRAVGESGKKALMFSLEMGGGQLFEREVSAFSNISTQKLKKVDNDENDLQDYQWGMVGNSLKVLEKMQIFVDDEPNLSAAVLISKCRKFKEENPDLALITIDYLTLMQLPRAQTQALSVGEMTRQIKLLAKELKTPILLLSQLNREADKAKREPRASDLRDSGSIEQDADIIIFPYREEIHNEKSKNKGLAKIIVSKYRDGSPENSLLEFRNGAFFQTDKEWIEEEIEEQKPRRVF